MTNSWWIHNLCRSAHSAKCAERFRSTIAEMRTGAPYCWGVPSTGVPFSKNIWWILDEYNIFAEVRTVRSAQKYFAAQLQKCAPGFHNCWGVPSTGVPYSWGVPAKTKPDEVTENRIAFISKSHVISLPGKCRVNYHSTTSTIDGLENPSSLLPIRRRFFVESRNKCFS